MVIHDFNIGELKKLQITMNFSNINDTSSRLDFHSAYLKLMKDTGIKINKLHDINQGTAFKLTKQYIEFSKKVIELISIIYPGINNEFFLSVIESVGQQMSNIYSFTKEINEENQSIQPKEITLGRRNNLIEENGRTVVKINKYSLVSFPVKNILAKLFEETNIIERVIEYKKKLEGSWMIENMTQTRYWTEKYKDHDDILYMYIIQYLDGFEPFNARGKHATAYSIDSIYITIGPIPQDLSSKICSIFTSQISFSGDRKMFGNATIFKAHIDQLDCLYKNGLDIEKGPIKKIIFVPHVFTGDNKSIKEGLGYVESFSCNYPCVTCKIEKNVLKKQTVQIESIMRNKNNINEDVEKNSPSDTGIKEKCQFTKFENFDPAMNSACDIMHDLHEGVIHYDLTQVLRVFISTEKFFTIDLLNERIRTIDLGDSKNKPDVISIEHLKKFKFQTTAAESFLLLEYIPFLIGDLIPEENDHWRLILLLREISRLAMSDRFRPGNFYCFRIFQKKYLIFFYVGEEKVMNELVQQHHELYIQLFGETLKVRKYVLCNKFCTKLYDF